MSSPQAVEIRPLGDPDQLRAAVDLYRRVFGLTPTDPAVGPRLLAALQHNGGSVIGAFAEGANTDELVGFVYGFVGMDARTGEVYHYSQTAAVAPEAQGAGVGRALKLGQRDLVLETGLRRMRWSFDPTRAPNAYFNLDILGARGRWFVPNLYGIEQMGPDVGLPSDRMIVDWDLRASDEGLVGLVERTDADNATVGEDSEPHLAPGEAARSGDHLLIGVPSAPTRDPATRRAVTDALAEALDAGWVAISCRNAPHEAGARYLLAAEPNDDVPEPRNPPAPEKGRHS